MLLIVLTCLGVVKNLILLSYWIKLKEIIHCKKYFPYNITLVISNCQIHPVIFTVVCFSSACELQAQTELM